MKKYFIILSALAVLSACNNNSSGSTNADSSAAISSSADISTNPDYQKGLNLIAANDCLTCHQINEKLVGPAYQEVADKYAGSDTAVTYLAHRVINGVGANDKHDWADETNNAIMTPHPQVSEADAEQMVKYILLLKTK